MTLEDAKTFAIEDVQNMIATLTVLGVDVRRPDVADFIITSCHNQLELMDAGHYWSAIEKDVSLLVHCV